MEFDKNLKQLRQDLKKYTSTNLNKLVYSRNFTFIAGLYSVYVSGMYLYFVFSIFGVISLLVSIILSFKIYNKQRSYIKNYDLKHCNPAPIVKKAGMSKLAMSTLGTITVAGTLGIINGVDTIYTNYTGESAFTKVGKYMGHYKGSEQP